MSENKPAKMLRICAEDPMWADHAEVSKTLLLRAAAEIERLTAALAAAVAEPVAAGFKMVPLEPTPEQIALLDPWMRPEAALELLRSVFAVALAAPACCCGEPTATGVVHRRDGPCFLAEAAAVAEPVAKQCEWTNCPTRVGNVCCNDRAAPAAPPQREPLTDADIDAACAGIECSNVDLGVYDRLIARAIERAHGIAPASAPKEQP